MGQLERAIAAPFASPVRTRSWFQSAGFLFSLEFVADWGRREWRQILRRARVRKVLDYALRDLWGFGVWSRQNVSQLMRP